MEKIEFIKSIESQMDRILKDNIFKNNIAQIRAKATLTQMTNQQLPIDFKFNINFVLDYSRFLLSSINYLSSLDEIDDDIRDKITSAAHRAAEAFEFLYLLPEYKDKENALLNACIAYHVAGYHANAIFLAGKLKDYIKVRDKQDDNLNNLYFDMQKTLIYFLERQIPNILVQTNQTIAQLRKLQNELIKTLKESDDITNIFDFSSQMGLHLALQNFALYTIGGNLKFLEESEKELENVYKLTSEAGDINLNFLISNLISELRLFRERNTWKNIRRYLRDENLNFRWKLYLRNLALGISKNGTRSKSIIEFWKSQIQALKGGLISTNNGYVVQMPTSAGKTKVAELAILSELIMKPGSKCIYLAPFRALAYEIEDSLSSVFSYLGFRVSSVVGGFESDDFENHLMQTSDVIVTTPEKIDLLFRSQPEFFDKVSLIVVDEGHIIEQLERGPKLELLLTRLKRKIIHTGARFLFISAVMPEINAKEFALWLAGNKDNVLSTKWRPTRRLLGKFEWQMESGVIYYPELKIGKKNMAFIPKVIEKGRRTKNNPPKNVTAARLAIAFVKQGPVLVFCGTPNSVKGVAKRLIEELNKVESQRGDILPRYNENLLSVEVAKEWLGDDSELIKCLNRGIGIHYGPMPEALRRAIEDDFRAGKLKILIATNTLGQGVNLPIKTAIIHSLNIRFNPGKREKWDYLKVREFWNICGRAGRASQDTEGQIIFITQSDTDEKLYKKYTNENNIERIIGVLYEVLEYLVQNRLSNDQIVERFSEMLIDTHLLSMLVEESIDTPDEDVLRDFLNDSLVKVQALNEGLNIEPLILASAMVSQRIYAEVEDKDLRKIFAKTGLSIKSCKILAQRIDNTIDQFIRFCEYPENKKQILKLIFNDLYDINEMREKRKKLNYKEGYGDFELLHGWINLMSLPELTNKFTLEENVENVAEYIDRKFIYRFSWGSNTFIKILAYKLKKEVDDLPLFLRYLPSMIKFGVNTHYASWAMSLGVHSRNLAYKIGMLFKEEFDETDDFNKFVKWFKTLNEEKLNTVGIFGFQTKTLMNKVSKLNIYDLMEYDKIINRIKEDGITTEIKGIEYKDRFKNLENVEEGQNLYLKRDYLNEYDIDAIKIYYNDKELGFIPRELARILAPLMDFGWNFNVMLKSKKDRTIKIWASEGHENVII